MSEMSGFAYQYVITHKMSIVPVDPKSNCRLLGERFGLTGTTIDPNSKDPNIEDKISTITDQIWNQDPAPNIGIDLEKSGLIVIEIKDSKDADRSLERLTNKYGVELLNTFTSKYCGKIRSYIFENPYPKKILPARVDLYPGLEFRDNGVILAPPSVDKNGEIYEFQGDVTNTSIKPAPPRLLERLEAILFDADPSSVPELFGVKDPIKIAKFILLKHGVLADEVSLFLALQDIIRGCKLPSEESIRILKESDQVYGVDLTDDLLNRMIDQVKRKGNLLFGRHLKKSKSIICSDRIVSDHFIARHGCNARYFVGGKKWYHWTGTKWSDKADGSIEQLVLDAVDSLSYDATKPLESDAIMKYQAKPNITGILSYARFHKRVILDEGKLDSQTWLLNCPNGTLDLKTGKLREHSRQDFQCRNTSVSFYSEAKCPKWDKFLIETFQDKDMVSYVQRCVGYAMTGSTREQCFFILYGNGANGKSTFLNVFLALFGNYGQQMPSKTLIHRSTTNVTRSDIVRLKGIRLAVAVETSKEQSFDEEMIKRITGGDKVSERRIYQDYVQFIPQCKIFLATNEIPQIKTPNHAMLRRIHLWPFDVTISEDQQNKELFNELVEELPGILNWAIEGCLEWQKQGLNPPKKVDEEVEKYKERMSVVDRFVESCCVFISHGLDYITAKKLWSAFLEFCKEEGVPACTRNEWAESMRKHPCTNKHPVTGRTLRRSEGVIWKGVLLNDEREEAPSIYESQKKAKEEHGVYYFG